MIREDRTAFNKASQECTNHRMVMVSSERVLVNPRYDNGSEDASNVKEYTHTYKCFGPCQLTSTFTSKPTQ